MDTASVSQERVRGLRLPGEAAPPTAGSRRLPVIVAMTLVTLPGRVPHWTKGWIREGTRTTRFPHRPRTTRFPHRHG